jgi:hypothetical protein
VKHVSPELFTPAGDVDPEARNRWERRRARIMRWAQVLDRHQGPFQLFSRLETIRGDDRCTLRVADSPVGVAFKDPVLREAGLAGDTLDDAMRFFGLTIKEAHWALCDCHFNGRDDVATPDMIAARLRKTASAVSVAERCHRVWMALRP